MSGPEDIPESIRKRIADRVLDDALAWPSTKLRVAVEPFARELVTLAIAETIAELDEWGWCSFDFHRSEADWNEDDANVCGCGKTRAEHDTIVCCPKAAPG